jgi:hypothetical protein
MFWRIYFSMYAREEIMKNLFILSLGLLTLAVPALANGTPDGQPPSEETVCSSLDGVLFGLCNAYCEAMDCDSPQPQASPTACARVLSNFMRHSGGQPPPCAVTCPCGAAIPLFSSIVSGSVTVQQCVIDSVSQVTSVVTPTGTFVLVNQTAAPPYCSANLAQFLQITPQEAAVCQQLLVQVAAGQGVTCVAPE